MSDRADLSGRTEQTAFTTPMDRTREIFQRYRRHHSISDPDHITIAVSGGTDSVAAADVFCRLAPEYGLEPDSVTHILTGTGIPQTRLTARLIAELHGLEVIEQGYRNPQDSLAERVLENGWPGAYGGSPMTGGHGLEWANRKDKPMDEVYVQLDGQQLWVSGARKLESKKRSGNVPDGGIDSDKPRRVWLSPIAGWTSEEKQRYIRDRGLPVSETYEVLGFSGECTGCAFDEAGLLTNIDLLCPERAHCLRTLAVWLFQRVLRGDVKLEAKRLCWGWEVDEATVDEGQTMLSDETTLTQAMVGCDEDSCATRNPATWVRELPDWQIVRRDDVRMWWDGEFGEVLDRFRHVSPAAEADSQAVIA